MEHIYSVREQYLLCTLICRSFVKIDPTIDQND